jgi:hypothetical protein
MVEVYANQEKTPARAAQIGKTLRHAMREFWGALQLS